jgi:hypothetical protein
MPAAKSAPKSLVEAVQAVFDALEPFDETARNRILQSATSLLGASTVIVPPTASVKVSTTPPAPSNQPHDRPMSPVELINDKKPATNAQRIAVFAYHRERVEGLQRFSKEDLRQYFPKAKLPQPQNFDRDFGHAVKLGWIYEDGDDSYLTSRGIEAVEIGFEGKGRPRGKAVAKRAGRGKVRRSPKR